MEPRYWGNDEGIEVFAYKLFQMQIRPGNSKASAFVLKLCDAYFLNTDLIVTDSFELNSRAFSEPLMSMISGRIKSHVEGA